jgi:hypothetical protein
MKRSKLEITKAVLKEIPYNLTDDHILPIEKVMFKWWLSGGYGTGLRLSNLGFDAFTKAKITYYEFPLYSEKTNVTDLIHNPRKFTLMLSKRIKCPFYITDVNKPTIKIYDDKIAMMVTLYGTLQEYLDSSGYK